jgi:hypothetical protein
LGVLTFFGNERSRLETEAAILSVPRFLLLSGPENVGKLSFVKGFLESLLDESDILVADTGPDGARQARPFLADMPSFSPFRAVLVDDMDFLSEPAQDSWLKLCEEAPGGSRIVSVVSDPSALLPPLLSRAARYVRWLGLSEEEMRQYVGSLEVEVDQFALSASCGRPGLYRTLSSPGYASLYESVVGSIASPSLDLPVPSVVKGLEPGRSVERTSAFLVVRRAALSMSHDPEVRPAALAFLQYAANMVRVPSANAELHWRNAVILSLKM